MIELQADQASVSGAMTMATAAGLLDQGEAVIAEATDSCIRFNLSAVVDMDSSALAVIFAWMRHATQLGKTLQLVNPPQTLLNLAAVYDVDELLPAH